MSALPTPLEPHDNKTIINQAFDACVLRKVDDQGNVSFEPWTCCICDMFVKPHNKQTISWYLLHKKVHILQPDPLSNVCSAIKEYYTSHGMYTVPGTGEIFDLSTVMISPRSQIVFGKSFARSKPKVGTGKTPIGLVACKYCYSVLHMTNRKPKFAICNGFFFGGPPKELVELNETELAFITPVKSYGYCFTYTGSTTCSMQLKGSLSFYKLNPSSIVTAVSKFSMLDLSENVVVVLYGKMTAKQHKKATARSCLRPHMVLRAVEWLCANHETFKTLCIDFDQLHQQLAKPIILDHAQITEEMEFEETVMTVGETAAGPKTNIETADQFQIFFPDKTINSTQGGCADRKSFEDFVKETKLSHLSFHLYADFHKHYVQDYKDDNLINACLLQFPYGRGGMSEHRLQDEEVRGGGSGIDILHYIKALSRKAEPQFHLQLFVLILYHFHQKQQMLRQASVLARNKQRAGIIAHEVNVQQVRDAISTRTRHGISSSLSNAGATYIGSVDAVAGSVAHSNRNTRKARRNAECLTHHFGLPTHFLTVTPDDNHCFLVQVYARDLIDKPGTTTETFTDEDLAAKHNSRVLLRIRYPGVCAFVFEMLMDIVIEKVIGWNPGTMTGDGMLGKCLAFSETVEEQGRLSLHGHFLVWIQEVDDARKQLFSTWPVVKQAAKKVLCDHIDQHVTTRFLFHPSDFPQDDLALANTFPHDCTVEPQNRSPPELADNQTLRNLRHKHVKQVQDENPFAICPDCCSTWSIESIIQQYLVNAMKVPSLSQWPEDNIHRLKTMCIQHQRDSPPDSTMPIWLVEAAYNVHRHRKNCFKKRKGPGVMDMDCRMKYPRPKKLRTTVQEVDDPKLEAKWYNFDGTFSIRTCYEVVVQRMHWDAFQNQSCPYISHSKLQCNTNIQVLLPGIVAAYVFKYIIKDTQEEDSSHYNRVLNHVSKFMANVDKAQLSNFSEAISRLLGSAIVHQSSNLVGAPMASYLTRNDSRFTMSHDFVWAPLRDLQTLLEGGKADFYLTIARGRPQWSCTALDYLCRSSELDDAKVFDFYSGFECKPNQAKYDDDPNAYKFQNTRFIHPSFNARTKKFASILIPTSDKKLIKVLQYDFPDSASFNGDIMDPATTINVSMERYSALVLILFVPFRALQDLQVDDSYTKKFRELYRVNYFRSSDLQFLQNIQDVKANSFRYISREDELQRCTSPLQLQGCKAKRAADEDDQEETRKVFSDMYSNPDTADLFHSLTRQSNHPSAITKLEQPTFLNLFSLRMGGSDQAGFRFLPQPTQCQNTTRLVQTNMNNDPVSAHTSQVRPHPESQTVTQSDLVTTLYVRSNRRRVASVLTAVQGDEPEQSPTIPATGSAKSIILWGRAANLDDGQQVAFEIITSHFVLSFYREVMQEGSVQDRSNRHKFLAAYRNLTKLTRTDYKRTPQLVGLLHGPGGSGKSKVINLLMEYAATFCANLPDYEFTSTTIRVCAYSGVAATLIKGETFHSALHINQRAELTNEQIEMFDDTRMVIVDEISFAKFSDFRKMHATLQTAKQNKQQTLYGGIDILFAGDFRQMDPVGGKPIFKARGDVFFQGAVNAYMELNGKHRFTEDPEWGDILESIREGTVTTETIAKINERAMCHDDILPSNTPVATHKNKDRDAKNVAVFHQQLLHDTAETGSNVQSVLIFAGDVAIKNNQISQDYVPCTSPFMSLYQHVGEDDIRYNDHDFRTDPVLKLRVGARVMVTRNIDVGSGIANGTVATVEKVVLQPGQDGFNVNLAGGGSVLGVYSNHVDHILLRHTDPDIEPPIFQLRPESFTIHPLIPVRQELCTRTGQREVWDVKVTHFPLIPTWATTVHKLQGRSLDSLFIHSWYCTPNWIYVALSRVRTRSGLFLNKHLSYNPDLFKLDDDYKRMIDEFRSHKTRPALDDCELQQLLEEAL